MEGLIISGELGGVRVNIRWGNLAVGGLIVSGELGGERVNNLCGTWQWKG